jgi:hypothetical protein
MLKKLFIAALLGGISAMVGPNALGDASLAFTINDRAPAVPAARVRWSFALATAPSPGVTAVTIGGVTAKLNEGFFQTLPSGDRFRLDAIASLDNGVTFLYEMRSEFNAGDFCSLKPGAPALPRMVSLNFTGPTITQHAIVTYTVAGPTPATTFYCQLAKRRVNTATASVTTAPAGAALLARHPLDVILVLDKSGSMAWGLPGAPFNSLPSRWTVLGNALDQFEALWEQASEAGVGGDRLAVIHFDTNASLSTFGGSPFKRRDGTVIAGDAHAWDEVLRVAKTPSPGGSTAIGKGLNLAIGSIDPNTFDAAMILMTDGEQNVAPLIEKIPATDDWALDDGAGGGPVELYKRGIPIQAIGFGMPADVEAQLLDGIASQTAGTSIIAASATGLSTALQDVLMQALKGNTVGLLARAGETVSPTAAIGTPLKLQIDSSVQRATFVLSWTGRRGLFELLLQPPGGGQPIKFTTGKQGDTWLVASVDIPAGAQGEWTAVVRGRDMSSAAPYQLSAYAVDTRLKYLLQFNRGRTGAGDAMLLAAEISFDGKPLTGIPGGVRLSLDRPGAGLGNILHETTETGSSPAGPDSASAYTAKVLALAREGRLAKIEPQPAGSELTLADNGLGGDERAGDGIYTTRFADTQVPGRYRFNVALEWTDPRTGKVRRVESIQREVVVVPDPSATTVAVLPGAGGNSPTVQVTLRDRFGNFVGPGYGNRFNVQVTGLKAPPASDPKVTGDYAFLLAGLPAGADPDVKISFDGQTIRSAPLSKLEAAPHHKCGCFDFKCKASQAKALASLGTLGGGVAIAGLMAYWPLRRRRHK